MDDMKQTSRLRRDGDIDRFSLRERGLSDEGSGPITCSFKYYTRCSDR